MSGKIKKYHLLFLDIASRVAEMSHDAHTQVGAVIVKDGNILSMGWNGMPPNFENECKDYNGRTKPEVIHAEANAIYKLARSGGNALGATLYCTHAPCVNCSLAILQSGISNVIYQEYRSDNGLYILDGSLNHICSKVELT